MSGKLEKILVPVGFSEGSRRAPRSVLMAHALPRQATGSTLTPVRGCASSGEEPGTTGVHGEEDVLGLQKAREVSDLAHGNARPPVGSANFSEAPRRPSVSSFPRSPFARMLWRPAFAGMTEQDHVAPPSCHSRVGGKVDSHLKCNTWPQKTSAGVW